MSNNLHPVVLYPGNNPTIVVPNSVINLFYANSYESSRGVYQDRLNPYEFVRIPNGTKKVKMTTMYTDPLMLRGARNMEDCKYKPIGGSFLEHSEIELCELYHYSRSCPDKYSPCYEFTLVNGHYTVSNPSMVVQETEAFARRINDAAFTHHLLGQFFKQAEIDQFLPYQTLGEEQREAFRDAHSACPGIMKMLPKCSAITEDRIKKANDCDLGIEEKLAATEEIFNAIYCCAKEHSPELKKALISGIRDRDNNTRRKFQFIVSESLWNLTLMNVREAWNRTGSSGNGCDSDCISTAFEFIREGENEFLRYNGYDIFPEWGFNEWDDAYIGKTTYAIIGTVQGNLGFAGRINPLDDSVIGGVTPTLVQNNAAQAAAIIQEGIGMIYGKVPGLSTKEWERLYILEVGAGVASAKLGVSDIQFF